MAKVTDLLEKRTMNTLRCKDCRCLLSVAPTFLTATGQNVCGRCKSRCDSFVTVNSLYNCLALQFNFPCRYVNEGCEITSNFQRMFNHEDNCPFRLLKCTNNDCAWTGIPIEFILHFKSVHPNFVIKRERKRELKLGQFCYMITKRNACFILQYQHSADLKLTLQIEALTFPNENTFFTCLLVNSKTSELIKKISLRHREEVVATTIPDSQLFAVKVKLPSVTRRSIICPLCLESMVPPILKCPSDHLVCTDCFDTNDNNCKTCEKDDLIFKRDRELETEAAYTMYGCRWTGCKSFHSVRQIQDHELNCDKRVYQCMDYTDDWEGYYYQLVNHSLECTTELQTTPEVTFFCKDIPESKELEFHVLAYKQLFRLCIDFEVWGIRINLVNYAFPSLYGWYRYEIDLTHVTESDFFANKTLAIDSRTYNIFSLDILGDDVVRFGGYEYLKLTARIVFLSPEERRLNVEHIYRGYK